MFASGLHEIGMDGQHGFLFGWHGFEHDAEYSSMVQALHNELWRKDLQLERLESQLEMKDLQLQQLSSELHDAQAELHRKQAELHQVQHQLEDARSESMTKSSCKTIGQWQKGLSALARVAQQLCDDADMMNVVGSLLHEPLTRSRIAGAYEAVWACHRQQDGKQDSVKELLHIVRDLLVLKVTIGRGPWSNLTLELTVAKLLKKPLQQSFNFDDQIVLSFNQILRFAQDRNEFFKTHVLLFSGVLSNEDVDAVHAAFQSSALTSPMYKSKTKLEKPNPRPKKQDRPRGQRSEKC